jgi:asparagine synthase (glutamine-hydrolysing)
MCGIAGIIAPTGLAPAALERMSTALEHRGPDAAAYLLHQAGVPLAVSASADALAPRARAATVGLAHRRLSIIDLNDRSDQPMIDATGRYALTYNGEIYNYIEIRKELERVGHRFRTVGDTEVVLMAYREWGPACVHRFVGMWAFALLDLDRSCLFLSRDRFGIKPLFYSVAQGGLRFASEIKALLATGDLSLDPNEDAVREFLLIGRADTSEESFFRGIFHLPPAHNAVVPLGAPSRVNPRRYWTCPPPGREAIPVDAAEEFASLLDDSVRLHARADVAVGTCLSGGLDSSAIVCVAERLREGGATPSFAHHGFGYVPRDPAYSERSYMDEVTKRTKIRMTFVQASSQRAYELISQIARQQDEPFGTASIVAQWLVFEAAAHAGLKVMLDGQGADEVLGGYHAYLPMVARTHLRNWRLLRYARFAAEHRRMYGARPLPPRDALASAVPALRRLGDVRSRTLTPAASMLSPSFRGRWHLADTASLRPRSINEILERATTVHLPALLRFEDRNSMAHSIEARVPFLDHRLVEFAFRLPGEEKITGAVTKHILRESLAGVLPDAIRARTDKIGFRADPDITWTLARRHRDALLTSATQYEDRWLEREALARLLTSPDRSPDTEAALWRVISLKLWLARNWSESGTSLAK